MKRTLLNLLGTLAVGTALGLPGVTAIAQLTAFTNPTPANLDMFGCSVAAVGQDRVLIGAYADDLGAYNAGAAYLFGTNGSLLATFTNPTPAANDNFGSCVAAVGNERVLVGAYGDATNAGAAYLFSTNGALLTTFTSPTRTANEWFGWSVAGVGTDRVLIGAGFDHSGGYDQVGAAYLFSTNGALLATLANPAPVDLDFFGGSVAAVGADRVLIAAPQKHEHLGATPFGKAYLFSTNGTLLVTFTDPLPEAPGFGHQMAAVGAERVLIGTSVDNSVYLFNTNGELLVTFTDPLPTDGGEFGGSVAAVGTDRVLIGAAVDSTVGGPAGRAYLFGTNGALLATFTNSTPSTNDHFGSPVAARANWVLIGAFYDNTGESQAGTAYLFSLEPQPPAAPSLSISINSQLSTINLSWPAFAGGWVLEQTNALPPVAVASWPLVPEPYQTNAGVISVTFTNSPPTGNQFFRLHKP